MLADVYPSDGYEGDSIAVPLARFTTPRQVLSDRAMAIEDKRALLASWASDFYAVENRPALRRLDDGTELLIDDILEALKTLDLLEGRDGRRSSVLPFPRHRLTSQAKSDGDDDDDPPPASVAMTLPPPPLGPDATPSLCSTNQRRSYAVVGQ